MVMAREKHHAAGDNADQRVENVVNQRVYDGGKRAADDDADGHVYHTLPREINSLNSLMIFMKKSSSNKE